MKNVNEQLAEQLARQEKRNYFNTTITVLWAFATIITAVNAFNDGNAFYIGAGIVSLAGAIFMTVKAYKKNK